MGSHHKPLAKASRGNSKAARGCAHERTQPRTAWVELGAITGLHTAPQHSVAPPTSAARHSATTSKATEIAAAFFSDKCLPMPPAAPTSATQESMLRVFFSFSLPTVIITMFKFETTPSCSILVTICPSALALSLPRSSPSVRQTSHREASAEATRDWPKICKLWATASKKQVPPKVSACMLANNESSFWPAWPFNAGMATMCTRPPKPTTPTRSQSRTWSHRMRRTHATHVSNRESEVPVSCDNMERLQSKQKTTTFGAAG
mmetsp:Transcript_116617/g.260498  ORF Transcript_116617/g.260498 Transcript_116617/m.260498 type:complete len:262 (-) Transcript_116617:709-1494(-)